MTDVDDSPMADTLQHLSCVREAEEVMAVEVSFSVEMIEKVLREWEEENPGKDAIDMGSDEFSRRMMVEIKASARIK